MTEPLFQAEVYAMREPCRGCGSTRGRIQSKGAQDCVFCLDCDRHCYNAPRTETGRSPRTVTRVHNGIKPKQKVRIRLRANGRCEICGVRPNEGELHVGHMISVKAGLAQGLTEIELNDDENLIASCDECNLGLGREPVPLRFAVALAMARIRTESDR